jgi:UDP-N-acetylglucosamine--N-acetylmuramyl-(pentapeptide) pyrophosphoryl-undecaprenol N-acetylglucosamine transferase
MSKVDVVIAAAGTGGHVFPGLAVAETLRRQGQGVAWVGTSLGLEARLVPQADIALHTLSFQGVRRRGMGPWLALPARLLFALGQALGMLRRLRPRVVLAMGGFVSVPAGLAARLSGLRLVVHEQNAIAGLSNRLLAPLAHQILTAFPNTFRAGIKTRLVGNPVRESIASLPPPQERLAGRTGPIRLLVLGGSQGAVALNSLVPQAIAVLRASGHEVAVRHQCGAGRLLATQSAYGPLGMDVTITEFISDMADAYAWADLAICRAGALTVSELSAAGLGAILIPYPFAVDDHQTHNAQWLADRGGAVVCQESILTPEGLARIVQMDHLDRGHLLAMACASRSLARPAACRDIAAVVCGEE